MKALVAGLIAVLLSSGTIAWGASPAVSINAASRFASGALGAAYKTGDAGQYIGCAVNQTGALYCHARNIYGVSVACYTFSPDFYKLGLSLRGATYISFGWSSDGICNSLYISSI